MLEISYILIFILLIIVIYSAIRKAILQINATKLKRFTFLFFTGIITWVAYLYLISNNGFLFNKSMPPRFPIFVFIPIILFMLIFFYAKRKSKVFELIPPSWPIYFQSFRILMEIVLFMTYTADIIPIQATFKGYNFEIIFALTAPIIGYFTFVKPIIKKQIAVLWNIIGIMFLFIVVGITISSYFTPEIWGSKEALIDIEFTKLPILLLPAFIVPSAIFVHIFSIIQLTKARKRIK